MPAPAPLERLAPAKINLGLHVLRKRTDGFHDIETVFLRVPWTDRLQARAAEQLTLTCTDPSLPTDERNLVVRAARRLATAAGVTQGAALHLDKQIPYGAGLGGGSSDAATALRMLADLWHLAVPGETLRALAAELGSDVPFFLDPVPCFASGRGEHLTPLADPATDAPYVFPFSLVVAVPPVHVGTAEAYGLVRPQARRRPDLRAVVCSNDLARWRRALVNDFEVPVSQAYPEIAAVKQALLAAGAGYAALSGSGSAVFGVFEEDGQAAAAAEGLRQAGHRLWHGLPA